MVDVIWATISACLGFMVYLALPFTVGATPIEVRRKVGEFYLKLGAKVLKQFALVRRVLSGYDVLEIDVEDDAKRLKTTLDSAMIGDDAEFKFTDPDNRIKRLWNKPVALAYENVPAAVDAELSEFGYWIGEKDDNEGLWSGDLKHPESVRVDPYVRMSDNLRLIDPIDAFYAVSNSVNPENIKTAEQKTKKRFEKYGSGLGAKEMLSGLLGFFGGIGGVMALQFFQEKFMDGSGGGGGLGGTEVVPMGFVDLTPILDAVVTVL